MTPVNYIVVLQTRRRKLERRQRRLKVLLQLDLQPAIHRIQVFDSRLNLPFSLLRAPTPADSCFRDSYRRSCDALCQFQQPVNIVPYYPYYYYPYYYYPYYQPSSISSIYYLLCSAMLAEYQRVLESTRCWCSEAESRDSRRQKGKRAGKSHATL